MKLPCSNKCIRRSAKGIGLLLLPTTTGAWFGYPEESDLLPVLRSFGAMLLGLGALTSFYGTRAKSWQQVDYIIRAEITYLALQAIVYVVSLLLGQGPALANVFMITCKGAIRSGALVICSHSSNSR